MDFFVSLAGEAFRSCNGDSTRNIDAPLMILFFFLVVTPVFPLRLGDRSFPNPAVAIFFAGVASGEISPDRTRFDTESALGNEDPNIFVLIGAMIG